MLKLCLISEDRRQTNAAQGQSSTFRAKNRLQRVKHLPIGGKSAFLAAKDLLGPLIQDFALFEPHGHGLSFRLSGAL
ncbi:MAG: hypothetical protein B7Y55_12550 [Polynucleobacter sp. 35-46-207]|nr:MAG: hypothetical protein B7Y55_12550 [Polynucleobacter sp. 35-46-207]